MKKPTLPHKRKPNKPNRKPALPKAKKEKSTSARAIPIAPENSDNPNIAKLVEARKKTDRATQAHRKFVWEMIAMAWAIAKALMKDKKSWCEFCALDWGKLTGPRVDQRDQALRFTLKFIFAKGKKGEKRASFYYNAVKALVEEGLDGKDLVKSIEKAGGLKKLQGKQSAKNKPRMQPKKVFDDITVTEAPQEASTEVTDNCDLFGSDDDDDDMEKQYRRHMDEGEDDDHLVEKFPPTPVNPQVEMPFKLIFPKGPGSLTSAKLPARIVIKGEIVSFGKSSVIKVDTYKVKKPKT